MTLRTPILLTYLTTLALGCDAVENDPDAEQPGAATKADTGGETDPELCAEGYEPIADSGECWADAGCYALPSGQWCTGLCPEGSLLDDSDVPQCIPAEPTCGCAEGYEPIPHSGECWADAGCYELPDGSWCTGLCPPGQQLDDSTLPQCVDAPFAGCLPGFEFTETSTGCIADAVCYEVVPYGWCTGECPDGGTFTMTEVGPGCI
jgi:hypothetical protein